MKVIKYKIVDEVGVGTEENPDIIQDIHEVIMPWSNANESIAKKEAYNGEYTIEEDGQPEPEPSREEQLETYVSELKEALDLLLSGVTE